MFKILITFRVSERGIENTASPKCLDAFSGEWMRKSRFLLDPLAPPPTFSIDTFIKKKKTHLCLDFSYSF